MDEQMTSEDELVKRLTEGMNGVADKDKIRRSVEATLNAARTAAQKMERTEENVARVIAAMMICKDMAIVTQQLLSALVLQTLGPTWDEGPRTVRIKADAMGAALFYGLGVVVADVSPEGDITVKLTEPKEEDDESDAVG